LRADATHYAVPDARALAENVDAFLAAAVPGAGDVVLLASELRKAHARGDARLSRALRAFTADPRHARGVKLFPNEHFRATSTAVGEHHAMHPRKRNAIIAARDGTVFAALPASAAGVAARAHAVLRAAGWYAAHVASARGVPMVVVTDDEALLELPPDAAPPGVVLSPPSEYFAAFRPGSRALAEFERVQARRRDAEEAERAWHENSAAVSGTAYAGKKHYPNHLSPREAAEGLNAGTLVRGVLRVRADAPDLAVVAATAAGGSSEPNGGGVPAPRDGARSADADDAEDDDEASVGVAAREELADASSFDENDASFFSFRFGGGDVLIPGRRARNRAFDGDEVAIRIFPPERWTRGPEVVAARAGRRGDEEDEEEDEEEDVGRRRRNVWVFFFRRRGRNKNGSGRRTSARPILRTRPILQTPPFPPGRLWPSCARAARTSWRPSARRTRRSSRGARLANARLRAPRRASRSWRFPRTAACRRCV
jgi:hypothetical protein